MKHFDKLLHFGAGTVITAGTFAVGFGSFSSVATITTAYFLTFLAAGLKEQFDIKYGGTFDGWDAYWTVAGGLFITLLCVLGGWL